MLLSLSFPPMGMQYARLVDRGVGGAYGLSRLHQCEAPRCQVLMSVLRVVAVHIRLCLVYIYLIEASYVSRG